MSSRVSPRGRGKRLCQLGIQCAILVLVLVVWNLSAAFNDGTGQSMPVPVVILKLPRSGSTWFTSELNAFSTVFLSKEIVQGNDSKVFGQIDVENHLIKALTRPVGKLSNSKNILPDSRFMEDYILPTHNWRWKPLYKTHLVGFTVNPEHVPNIDWSRVAREVPGIRVVALLRNNLIKTAISDYTGKNLKEKCGSANLRHQQTDCKGDVRVPWTAGQFVREVNRWHSRRKAFLASVEAVQKAVNQAGDAVVVTYEGMQVDKGGTFKSLFKALGVPSPHEPPLTRETWTKRGPEELREVLTNYADLESVLAEGGARECPCLLRQLRSKGPPLDLVRPQQQLCDLTECPSFFSTSTTRS